MCAKSYRCLKSKYLSFFSARRVSRYAGKDVTWQISSKVMPCPKFIASLEDEFLQPDHHNPNFTLRRKATKSHQDELISSILQ
jgi:hypothetical protein